MAKAGRKKRKFTEAQVRKMKRLALAGCQNNTIATIMDIPMNTLKRHFGKLLTKKRCERKYIIRRDQKKHCRTNPTMAIFLGKNELGQADKQEHTGQDGGPISVHIVDFAKAGG